VHLIHAELHAELREQGFDVGPGQIAENVLTAGVDLLGLPCGTLLHLGERALSESPDCGTPARRSTPSSRGLLKAVVGRDKNGVMGRRRARRTPSGQATTSRCAYRQVLIRPLERV
jgi:MOSC domain-containing protein YiiM